MPFELSNEHKIVRKITQEFTKREVIPYREKLLKEDEYPEISEKDEET